MSKDAAVPARYLDIYFRFFEQIGVDVSAAMRASHLTTEQLARLGAMLSAAELETLLDHLYSRSEFQPDLFLKGGQLFKLGSHDMLGYAMLSSPTIDHAWRIHGRFFKLILPAFSYEYQLDGKYAVLKHTPVYSFSSLALTVLFESIASITNANVQELTGGNVPAYDIFFSTDRPAHAESFRVLKGARCHFLEGSSPQLKMVFPAEMVTRQLPMANTSALLMAEDQCKRLVGSIVTEGKMADWITMMLRESHNSLPSMNELAGSLNISKKTLNRHLKKEGTGFRALSEQVKNERAVSMLKENRSITEIALTLGYSEPVNFTRAFHRMHGVSPSDYKKKGTGSRG